MTLFYKKLFYKLFVSVLFSFVTVLSLSGTSVADHKGLYPHVNIPASAGDSCVRPSAEMRKVHPDLLKHDRINTMRLGIRSQENGKILDGSLKACINCHAIKKDEKYVRIDSEEHFCSSCHIYAGVSFDCFQCHRDTPEK